MLQTKTILKVLPHCLKTINLPFGGKKLQGKVRDFYVQKDNRIIITTDRQSAFDYVLGAIPYKGAVLNQLAAFWFQKTKHIIPNHLISLPDPNVTIAKNLTPIPVEMVVRGYMSGVTKTSIWYSYQQGEREIYGIHFPDGLKKNDKLPTPVITPTTHGSPSASHSTLRDDSSGSDSKSSGSSSGHDERLTKKEILEKKIVSKKIYEQMEQASLKLFSFGSKLAEKKGLILVDTKYEFGLDEKGNVTLMDEIHTPDSSRFWIKKTYKKRLSSGEEPENFDKEFLRLWYFQKGYRGDGKPPKMTDEIITALSKRYIAVYEILTGKKFKTFSYPIEERIIRNVHDALSKNKKKEISLAVLISNKGKGTNLQGIIDGIEQKKLHAKISVVISDEEDAYGLIRAGRHKIPTAISKQKEHLLPLLQKYTVDYIALTGWKQFLTDDVLSEFSNRILNLHPGLVPNTKDGVVKNPDGTKGLWNKKKFTEKALQNFLDNNATYAGSSIHFLTKEIDFGPVLGRTFEKIRKNDTVDSLYKRLKKKEQTLFLSVLQKLTL